MRKLTCGVPQGSVLGPLLYLLYTSPLADVIRRHDLSFHMYADYTQLYTAFTCGSEDELPSTKYQIESCISDFDKWMAVNKLKLNKDKTELLHLHSRFSSPSQLHSLTFGNDNVYFAAHARNIGVTFDYTFSYEKQINDLVKSSFFHLRNIAKVRNYLSDDLCKILIQSLVCSKINNFQVPKRIPPHLLANTR